MRHLVSSFLLKNSHYLYSHVSELLTLTTSSYHFLAFRVSPFCLQLFYFIILSLFGFVGLKFFSPRAPLLPNDIDLLYTSVSASTVSSMTVLEMESFSNSQLILIIFLMFLGGEVFTSMLGLLFSSFNLTEKLNLKTVATSRNLPILPPTAHQIEIGIISLCRQNETCTGDHSDDSNLVQNDKLGRLKQNSMRCLSFVVLGYLLIIPVIGSGLLSSYVSIIPSVRQVVRSKGINTLTFSVFTIVSTFASCGFLPTNENMLVFKQNPGLLLLILPFVFLGNTLYAPFLRLVIWVAEKVAKREEFSYILRNYEEMGYDHMLSGVQCLHLVATVVGLNLFQFVLFCFLEWKSENMEGLNNYEKIVSSLFQVSNARHSGESVFNLSTLSPAILVLFVVMMYLPPYTMFLPLRNEENDRKKEKTSLKQSLVFSQLSYLVMFIILICITENENLREDPINFNVFNITLEVISAYGNVGFSMGYSCKSQLKADGKCRDEWVGFSGKWTHKGRLILIVIMFFGRLKKFNMRGGRAWVLS